MRVVKLERAEGLRAEDVRWAFALTSRSSDVDTLKSLPFTVFGMTSHGGVFTSSGYTPGSFLLVAGPEDGVYAKPYFAEGNVHTIEAEVARVSEEIKRGFGKPDILFVMPTLGLEERVVRVLDRAFESGVRIFGGTAADNDFSGDWWTFTNGMATSSGVVVVAFKSDTPILSTFHAGYILTRNRGVVTKAEHPDTGGTIIYEIDGKPAAEVYASWLKTHGFDIGDVLRKGGIIPFEIAGLNPIARAYGRDIVVSHVFEVLPEKKAVLVLSYIREGEEVYHATATDSFLVSRTAVVVRKSLDPFFRIAGGILVYCAGCIAPIKGRLDEISKIYRKMVRGAPFIGAATYGEQGSIRVKGEIKNFHANQMINTVIFTRR